MLTFFFRFEPCFTFRFDLTVLTECISVMAFAFLHLWKTLIDMSESDTFRSDLFSVLSLKRKVI